MDPLTLIGNEAKAMLKKCDKPFKQTLDYKRTTNIPVIPILDIENIGPISKRISPPIGHTIGFPTCITISTQFILIGNERGVIFVFLHNGTEKKALAKGNPA